MELGILQSDIFDCWKVTLLLGTCYLLLATLLLVTCYLVLAARLPCYLLLVTWYLLLVTCYLLQGYLATWSGCKMSLWPNADMTERNCTHDKSRLIVGVFSIGILGIWYFVLGVWFGSMAYTSIFNMLIWDIDIDIIRDLIWRCHSFLRGEQIPQLALNLLCAMMFWIHTN